MSKVTNFLGELAGYYKEIEVAKASNNGLPAGTVRTESIADQTAVGTVAPTGPGAVASAPNNNVRIFGVEANKSLVYATVGIVGALAIVKVMQ